MILPHIARTLFPPLSNHYILMTLGTSMAAIFGVEELTGRALNVNSETFRSIEVYERTRVLDGVSFGVDKGQIVSLIGPSGSGKSTVLRVLMRLLPPIGGHVSVGGARVDYSNRAQLRDIRNRFAVVFQQYNLFQNMCALDNVTVAPVKVQRRGRARWRRRRWRRAPGSGLRRPAADAHPGVRQQDPQALGTHGACRTSTRAPGCRASDRGRGLPRSRVSASERSQPRCPSGG